MSEQEIKNQIERDARNYAIKLDSDYRDNAIFHYATGANAQDKIASERTDKIATNRTVEEAIMIFKSPWPDGEWVIKEFEKLRR